MRIVRCECYNFNCEGLTRDTIVNIIGMVLTAGRVSHELIWDQTSLPFLYNGLSAIISAKLVEEIKTLRSVCDTLTTRFKVVTARLVVINNTYKIYLYCHDDRG